VTVRGLGADEYGLLALTAALTGYLGLMEMGLGTAIMRYLSYHHALDEGRPMLGIISFAVRWFGAAGVVGGTFLWLAAPWLATTALHVPAELETTAITVLHLTGINFLLAMLISIGTAIPQSFLRYDIAAGMSAIWGTLAAAGPAVIVSLGRGLVAVVWFSVISNLAALGMYTFIGWRLMRTVPLDAGPPWQAIRRRTLRFAGVTALNQIGYQVAAQTSRLVVGIAGGVAAAAYYQVPYVLSSRVNDMLSRVAQVLFPTASGLMAHDDLDAVRRLYLRTSRLFFVLNFSVTGALVVLADPLLRYWVSPTYAEKGAIALAVFSLSQSLHATTMSASYVNLSAARPGINLAFATMSSVISLGTVYPLTATWGVSGAALAGLLGAANVPFFLHYGHTRVLHVSSWLVWRRCYQPTVLGVSSSCTLAYFALRPLCHGLALTLAIWCLVVVMAMGVSGLFGGLAREDWHTVRRLGTALLVRLRLRAEH